MLRNWWTIWLVLGVVSLLGLCGVWASISETLDIILFILTGVSIVALCILTFRDDS